MDEDRHVGRARERAGETDVIAMRMREHDRLEIRERSTDRRESRKKRGVMTREVRVDQREATGLFERALSSRSAPRGRTTR